VPPCPVRDVGRQPLAATDLGLVAFLQLKGLAFELDRSAFPMRFLFGDPSADELSRQYWDRAPESQIPAQAFMVALQGVKSQIFRRGHGSGRRLDIGHERSSIPK
jgi:hypothetical protein